MYITIYLHIYKPLNKILAYYTGYKLLQIYLRLESLFATKSYKRRQFEKKIMRLESLYFFAKFLISLNNTLSKSRTNSSLHSFTLYNYCGGYLCFLSSRMLIVTLLNFLGIFT